MRMILTEEEVQNGIEIAEKCIGKNSLRLIGHSPKNYRDAEWQGIALANAGYKLKSVKGN